MYTPTAVSEGLERLVRDAVETARQGGQHDVVTRLEAVLQLTAVHSNAALALDILAGEVRRDGQRISLSRGERAVLIALAIRRRPCAREELVEMLYPHLDETIGAVQLKVYVHRIRRRLGDPQAIIFGSDAYRLGPNLRVDYWDVESELLVALRSSGPMPAETFARLNDIRSRLLRRNISWTGDREWATELERHLETLMADVTVRLGEAALADGNFSEALKLALDLFHLDPCDERGARLTVQAHVAEGHRDAAMRALRRYERVLREQFDVRPSPELLALVS